MTGPQEYDAMESELKDDAIPTAEIVDKSDPKVDKPKRLPPVLTILGIVIVIAIIVFLTKVDPDRPSIFPKCIFHQTTGYHCPGCGTLRAIHQLLQGNIIGAWGYNKAAVLLLPICLYAGFAAAVYSLFNIRLPLFKPKPWMILALFYAIVLYWILRNVPYYPFTLLAPHG